MSWKYAHRFMPWQMLQWVFNLDRPSSEEQSAAGLSGRGSKYSSERALMKGSFFCADSKNLFRTSSDFLQKPLVGRNNSVGTPTGPSSEKVSFLLYSSPDLQPYSFVLLYQEREREQQPDRCALLRFLGAYFYEGA